MSSVFEQQKLQWRREELYPGEEEKKVGEVASNKIIALPDERERCVFIE